MAARELLSLDDIMAATVETAGAPTSHLRRRGPLILADPRCSREAKLHSVKGPKKPRGPGCPEPSGLLYSCLEAEVRAPGKHERQE
jgi:hypothetical protein